MLNAGFRIQWAIQGRSPGGSVPALPCWNSSAPKGRLGMLNKYNRKWIRFSCIYCRGSLTQRGRRDRSEDRFSHHPLHSVARPLNLVPKGMLPKWIGRQGNTKHLGMSWAKKGKETGWNKSKRNWGGSKRLESRGEGTKRGMKKVDSKEGKSEQQHGEDEQNMERKRGNEERKKKRRRRGGKLSRKKKTGQK